MNYSQNNEQAIIKSYFGGQTGTFLDIGCNDAKTFSNTYRLLEKGWNGTLVDCSPQVKGQLIENTKPFMHQIQIIEVAVGPFDGETSFYESGSLLGEGDVSLVSSVNPEEMNRWKSRKIPFEKITVPMLTFRSLLKRSMYKHFDLVSIDIEGMERFVIPQIDFKSLETRMAIIEFNGKDEKFFTEYMTMFGFSLHHKNAENLIYTLNKI